MFKHILSLAKAVVKAVKKQDESEQNREPFMIIIDGLVERAKNTDCAQTKDACMSDIIELLKDCEPEDKDGCIDTLFKAWKHRRNNHVYCAAMEVLYDTEQYEDKIDNAYLNDIRACAFRAMSEVDQGDHGIGAIYAFNAKYLLRKLITEYRVNKTKKEEDVKA